VETKLEAYTDRIKKLEQANAGLEHTLQEQRELLLARDKEQESLRTQFTQIDLNLGASECTHRVQVAGARSCKLSATPKRRRKTPKKQPKEELFLWAETPNSSKEPRCASARKVCK